MNKLSINWQNFVQVKVQLKFAFRIRPYEYLHPKKSKLLKKEVTSH